MYIDLWCNSNNNCHAKDFLESLDPFTRRVVTEKLLRLKSFSFKHLLKRTAHLKQLENDLYEIKISTKHIRLRLVGVYEKETFFVLDIFKKKTQKIPLKNLKRARERLREYKLNSQYETK